MFVAIKPETVCGLINWKLSDFPSIISTIQKAALSREEPVFLPAQSALISQLSEETEKGTVERVLKMSKDCFVILDLIMEFDEIYEIQICSSILRLQKSNVTRELMRWDVIGGLLYPWGDVGSIKFNNQGSG